MLVKAALEIALHNPFLPVLQSGGLSSFISTTARLHAKNDTLPWSSLDAEAIDLFRFH